ncbi:MAG: sigma-70 family RNA polymerase sigma factor [Verrucomicrobia bacterium]|jgi:RNA polymerase sigma-70 factor (ECF subfamily)|nr:MAG: sigma-70 family RNA polymerase sigma factor [Verrucomicrobiota bacterium]
MNSQPSTPDEVFVQLLSQNEPLIRSYLRNLLPSYQDVDQVMPDVALVAWRKFSQLEDHDAFARWACVIARYEVMSYRRSKARDRLVLDPDVVARLADEAEEEMPLRRRQMNALEHCLAKLPPQRRDLVLACYSPEKSMRDIAAEINRSENSLYQLLRRIRVDLQECMEKNLSQESLS